MEIEIIENGPALIKSSHSICISTGEGINKWAIMSGKIYLCRCGKTKDKNKIFCDGCYKK